jgi:hypothetical protein
MLDEDKMIVSFHLEAFKKPVITMLSFVGKLPYTMTRDDYQMCWLHFVIAGRRNCWLVVVVVFVVVFVVECHVLTLNALIDIISITTGVRSDEIVTTNWPSSQVENLVIPMACGWETTVQQLAYDKQLKMQFNNVHIII